MPAVTVSDLTTLPKIDLPKIDGGGAPSRPVISVTEAPSGFEGEGFPVRRAFAGVPVDLLDPFVHMDQMGEVEYAPGEPRGTGWHPHRGFETVTYMIDGTFAHRDSQGGGGLITNGATQWMTAGSGILHRERPPEELVSSGGLFHGVQLWVNLPAADKWRSPAYQSIEADRVALFATPDAGALIRLIAGKVGDQHGPGSTHTPITLAHLSVSPGAQVILPWDPSFNALVYVLAGRGSVGPDGHPVQTGRLATLGAGSSIVAHGAPSQDAMSDHLELLVLGGRPIREPVATYGPFVMNTRAELQQALDDFQRGRMGTIPAGP